MERIEEVVVLDSWREANERLGLGWVLLNTYTTCYDTEPPRCAHQFIHFVLGRSFHVEPLPTPKEDPLKGFRRVEDES